MFNYLLKQSFRANKIMLKKYLLELSSLIGVGIFFVYIITSIFHSLDMNNKIINLAVNIISILISLLYIIALKTSVFNMHPATIHYFSNNNIFKKVLKYNFIIKIISNCLIGIIVSFVIYNFRLYANLLIENIFLLSVFINLSMLTKWIKYNENKKWLFISIVSSILFLYFTYNIEFSIFFLLWAIVITYYSYNQEINLDKFLKDMTRKEMINYHTRNKNYAEMQRIMEEHLSQKNYKLKLYNFKINYKNILFYKSVIETIRLNGNVLKIFLAVIIPIFALSVFKIEFVFLGVNINNNIYTYITVFILISCILNIEQTISNQLLKLQDTIKKGVIIPYSIIFITLNYVKLFSFISSIFIILSGIVFRLSILKMIILIFLIDSLVLVFFFFENIKNKKIPSILKNTIFLILILISVLI